MRKKNKGNLFFLFCQSLSFPTVWELVRGLLDKVGINTSVYILTSVSRMDFPDDSLDGAFGYCTSFERIPVKTWLKLGSMEPDQVTGKNYKLTLLTRDGKRYQVWASPRILGAVQRYQKLLEEERFHGKTIFFKYYQKIWLGKTYSVHDFRLIIH